MLSAAQAALVVLDTPAVQGSAAKLIANALNEDGAGFFIHSNSGLGVMALRRRAVR